MEILPVRDRAILRNLVITQEVFDEYSYYYFRSGVSHSMLVLIRATIRPLHKY